MKTLRSALWWAGIAWIFGTALVLAKVFIAPELAFSTPLSDPPINNLSLSLLFGSLVVLFFILPPIEPVGLLVLGVFAAVRALWRRAWGH